MKRYVSQLVADFRRRTAERLAALGADPAADYDPLATPRELSEGVTETEHLAEIDRYLEAADGSAETHLAELVEVDLAELPAPDALDRVEAAALYASLNDLIATVGHQVEVIPAHDCPPQPLYAMMLAALAEPARAMAPGGIISHGCPTYAPECPLGQYCGCLEYYDYDRFVAAGGDPSVPRERFGRPVLPLAPGADLSDLQGEVDRWIASTGAGYFGELTNVAILAEETGEVARLAARLFGEQTFKRPADEASAKTDWADELADVLFVLTALANQTDVDLSEAFRRGMEKRRVRDVDRYRGGDPADRAPDTDPGGGGERAG